MQTSLEVKKPNGSELAHQPMNIIEAVQARIVTGDLPIETLERLLALRDRELARQAEIEFNEALARVQAEVRRVAADLENKQTRSYYESYAAIDKMVRPIYSREGFSLSFDTETSHKDDYIRSVCLLSRGAHTRTYRLDVPADGKGAKGGDVMTKTHATAAALSYARRYQVKGIFNIAIGADDMDGNAPQDEANTIPDERYVQLRDAILGANTDDELKRFYQNAIKEAQDAKDDTSARDFNKAKNQRYRELHNAGR